MAIDKILTGLKIDERSTSKFQGYQELMQSGLIGISGYKRFPMPLARDIREDGLYNIKFLIQYQN